MGAMLDSKDYTPPAGVDRISTVCTWAFIVPCYDFTPTYSPGFTKKHVELWRAFGWFEKGDNWRLLGESCIQAEARAMAKKHNDKAVAWLQPLC